MKKKTTKKKSNRLKTVIQIAAEERRAVKKLNADLTKLRRSPKKHARQVRAVTPDLDTAIYLDPRQDIALESLGVVREMAMQDPDPADVPLFLKRRRHYRVQNEMIELILNERRFQAKLFSAGDSFEKCDVLNNDVRDDKRTPVHWYNVISDYNGMARNAATFSDSAARKRLIQVAALALAAAEAITRKMNAAASRTS